MSSNASLNDRASCFSIHRIPLSLYAISGVVDGAWDAIFEVEKSLDVALASGARAIGRPLPPLLASAVGMSDCVLLCDIALAHLSWPRSAACSGCLIEVAGLNDIADDALA